MIKEFQGEYCFLSNFYISPIIIKGQEYSTVEHFYQSEKAINQKDKELIINASTPGEAKRLARNIHLIDRWDKKRDAIMKIAILEKFKQNRDLLHKLILTGDNLLIEGNYWHDNYWGNCFCNRCKNIEGQNKLGKILMGIRRILK